MNFMSIPKMVVSPRGGWIDLDKLHPAILKLFVYLVLPLSLLPPVMLYYAGTRHGNEFISGFADRPWDVIAMLFFHAEMLTFLFMGWFIKQVTQSEKTRVTYHAAYMIAAIAPVPMWLSALGLFAPSLAFNACLSLSGLGLSCALIYHGIRALCHMEEEVNAASAAYVVMASGLIAWALLLVAVFLF